MGPLGDREDGPGERLSHSPEMEKTVVAELERFRHSWWKEFNKHVVYKVHHGADIQKCPVSYTHLTLPTICSV
eukprot:1008384-Alexandrium_andersonii.AAC.1